jgi:protein involved in polysaccharide export with SLBB domain
MKTAFRIAILMLGALPCLANAPAHYSAPAPQPAPAALSTHTNAPAPQAEKPGHFDAHAPLKFEALNVPQGPPADLLNEPHDPYRVGPGDKLELELMEVPDTRQISIVMPDGDLYYQTAHVHAAGLTITDLKATLEKQLQTDYRDPQLSMILREMNS